jgi:hypothetical protein
MRKRQQTEPGKRVRLRRISPMPAECQLLTTRETAKILNLSVRRLYDLPLPYIKFGTDDWAHKRFVLADVLRFIEERKIGKPTDQVAA